MPKVLDGLVLAMDFESGVRIGVAKAVKGISYGPDCFVTSLGV